MTLSPDRGGVFDTLLGLVRRGLGGRAGDGRQFMSWIHDQDFTAAVRWLIDREAIDGIVNVASPNPLPNAEFMRLLREAAGVPFGLPATGVDARDRGDLHAHRDRARAEEPSSRSRPSARGRLQVPVSRLAGCRAGPVPPVEGPALAQERQPHRFWLLPPIVLSGRISSGPLGICG